MERELIAGGLLDKRCPGEDSNFHGLMATGT